MNKAVNSFSVASPDKRVTYVRYYFKISALCFVLASVIGLLTAAKVGWPQSIVGGLSMVVLRPLHTFVSLFAVVTGLTALVHYLIKPLSLYCLQKIQWAGFMLFLVFAGLAIVTGNASGREYFSWPLWACVPLFVALGLLVWQVFSAQKLLNDRSPEAFWLVGFGCLFIFNGLFESQLWGISQLFKSSLFSNYVADLTVQWHGVDTFFAGINTAMYGALAFLLSSKPRPLRKPVLFFVAGFSVLFTFGHHHYVSPQSSYLKHLAFIASMVAMLSFWRHMQAYKTRNADSFKHEFSYPLWRSVELWTLVSIISGVVFAIPQINLVIHGTYMVLIHAMGSIIGINLMIVILGGLIASERPELINPAKVKLGAKLVNISLGFLWLNLCISGLTKGILRFNSEYEQYQPIREWILASFPIVGLFLLVGIAMLCHQLFNAHSKKKQNEELEQVMAFQQSPDVKK